MPSEIGDQIITDCKSYETGKQGQYNEVTLNPRTLTNDSPIRL